MQKFQTFDKLVPVNLVARRVEAPAAWRACAPSPGDRRGRETKPWSSAPRRARRPWCGRRRCPHRRAATAPHPCIIFFVGQGGVGKSSCAAAAAVTLTEKEGPVLLISVDPAHGLSDVLQSRLTDTETR